MAEKKEIELRRTIKAVEYQKKLEEDALKDKLQGAQDQFFSHYSALGFFLIIIFPPYA